MTKLTIAAAALAAVTLFATAGSAFAVTGVATGAVNVREDAGTEYDIVGHLSKGEFVEILECDAGWCSISDDGDQGYVSAGYLAVVEYDDEDEDDDYGHHDHHDYDDVDVEFEFDHGGVEVEFEF
jgi:uncharacterized protein YraI